MRTYVCVDCQKTYSTDNVKGPLPTRCPDDRKKLAYTRMKEYATKRAENTMVVSDVGLQSKE